MNNRNRKDTGKASIKKYLLGRAATIRRRVGGVTLSFIDNGLRGVGSYILGNVLARTEKEDEAIKIFKDVFGPLADIRSSTLGNKTYPTESGWSPDNLAAHRAIKDPLELPDVEATVISDEETVEIDRNGDIVVIGGPVSTPLSMVAFEFEGPNHDELDRPVKPIIPLKYYGIANKKDVSVKSDKLMIYKAEGMGERSRVNWHLVNTYKIAE